MSCMYTASIHTISYIIILSYKSFYIWHVSDEIDAVTEPQIPADMVEYRMNCSVLTIPSGWPERVHETNEYPMIKYDKHIDIPIKHMCHLKTSLLNYQLPFRLGRSRSRQSHAYCRILVYCIIIYNTYITLCLWVKWSIYL